MGGYTAVGNTVDSANDSLDASPNTGQGLPLNLYRSEASIIDLFTLIHVLPHFVLERSLILAVCKVQYSDFFFSDTGTEAPYNLEINPKIWRFPTYNETLQGVLCIIICTFREPVFRGVPQLPRGFYYSRPYGAQRPTGHETGSPLPKKSHYFNELSTPIIKLHSGVWLGAHLQKNHVR